MTAPERALLTALRSRLAALTAAAGTLEALPATPDEYWSLAFTRGPTDPHGRWGAGVLMLQTRGTTGVPLDVHDIADPLVRSLNGLTGLVLDGVTVNDCQHAGSSTGRDASKRSLRADRFNLDLDYQATYQAS